MDYEFVFKVDADVLRKEKKVRKGQPLSVLHSKWLKEDQISKKAHDQLSDIDEWTGFGNIVSFKSEPKECIQVLLLEFLPLKVGELVAGIRPQMASFYHSDLSGKEIEQKIYEMGMQWGQLKRGIYFQEMQLQCVARFGEITPQGLQTVVLEALQEMGGSENFPILCMWEEMENGSTENEKGLRFPS
jgi:hypothetical protein